MYIPYIEKRFNPATMGTIIQAREILEEFNEMGFTLTLRQLYYQFVAKALIPNKQSEYDRLGSIMNNARLAGAISWNHLEDRTREMKQNAHWDSPRDVLQAAMDSYALNKWDDQPNYVEVWIEKDALVGIIEKVCRELDVPFFSCRGYTSQSEAWRAGQRMTRAVNNGKNVTVIHLGDHDPSGIDMSYDIWKRLNLFVTKYDWETIREVYKYAFHITDYFEGLDSIGVNVHRIALNHEQVIEHSPPPNPTKLTDSRAEGYIEHFGYASWELDALDPITLSNLVERNIIALRDDDIWEDAVEAQESDRAKIAKLIEENY